MTSLEGFKDTKWLEVDGNCKKLKSWAFVTSEYCVPGDCDPRMVFVFEDGTRKQMAEVGENCNTGT